VTLSTTGPALHSSGTIHLHRGWTVLAVCEAHGRSISRSLIQRIQKCETGQLTNKLNEIRIAEHEGKITELERKVSQLTMEVDLLKKGMRRPSDDSLCGAFAEPTRRGDRLTGRVFSVGQASSSFSWASPGASKSEYQMGHAASSTLGRMAATA
jgi:hypothetical protein